MSTPRNLSIALLGLGRAGQFHLQSIRPLDGVDLKYAVDIDSDLSERVAASFQCSAATTAEEALNDPDVNAVIVATPTEHHYDAIMTALEAGKAVFTEKPLGEKLEQIDACFDLARQRQLPLFVGFNRRFDPSFSSLANQVRQGSVGIPKMVRITSRDSPLPTIDYIRTSHGIFHDCIVHDLDMLRFITGEDPIEIYAVGSSFFTGIGEVNDLDNVLVSLKYKGGMLASIDVNRHAVYGYDQRIEVFGSKGMVQAENRSPESTVVATECGFLRPPIEFSFPTRYRDAYVAELKAFRDVVINGSTVPITHEDVRTSHRLCDLADIACKLGTPQTFSTGDS